jgi:hypothetical protein
MKQKTIPLSLHTRRAVGMFAYTLMRQNESMPADYAVGKVFELLGYPSDTPDTHGLRDQVLSDVIKASQS